jgi:site-specific DNA-adenine methylase
MKVVSIFAENLYSFHYDGEVENEYNRLMNLWTDTEYLREYATQNGVADVYGFVNDILKYAEAVQNFLDDITHSQDTLELYFEALQESERKKPILSLQKGKIRRNQLRLYAVKIDSNCFVITGGAIKMSQRMDEHPDTEIELKKLNAAREYFRRNGVFDEDSFFELLIEN